MGDLAQGEDRGGRDQEGGAVEVQREVDAVGGEERKRPCQHAGEQRQQREDESGDRRGSVGRQQAQLVGLLEPVARYQVRHRGFLGRNPEQAQGLDEERRDEQPPQRVHDRDRHVQREPADVGDDHRESPVEAIGEGAGERSEQHRGQQPHEDDEADRGVLDEVGVAGRERRRKCGLGEEAEPVTEARQRQRDPQLAERLDREHTPKPADLDSHPGSVDQRSRVRPRARDWLGNHVLPTAAADGVTRRFHGSLVPLDTCEYLASVVSGPLGRSLLGALACSGLLRGALGRRLRGTLRGSLRSRLRPAVFLAGRRAAVFFGAGPRARLSASNSAARSSVIAATSSPLRRVALVSPSVT